jgi:hypothetical protein
MSYHKRKTYANKTGGLRSADVFDKMYTGPRINGVPVPLVVNLCEAAEAQHRKYNQELSDAYDSTMKEYKRMVATKKKLSRYKRSADFLSRNPSYQRVYNDKYVRGKFVYNKYT